MKNKKPQTVTSNTIFIIGNIFGCGGNIISLKTNHDTYVEVQSDGKLGAYRTEFHTSSLFEVKQIGLNTITLKSMDGRYVTALGSTRHSDIIVSCVGQNNATSLTVNKNGRWNEGEIGFQIENGNFILTRNDGKVTISGNDFKTFERFYPECRGMFWLYVIYF